MPRAQEEDDEGGKCWVVDSNNGSEVLKGLWTVPSPRAVLSQSRVCAVAWAVPNLWDIPVPGLAPPHWGCSAPPCPVTWSAPLFLASCFTPCAQASRGSDQQQHPFNTEEVEMTFQHPTTGKKLPGLEIHYGHYLPCEWPTLQRLKPFGVSWWCTVIPISMAILLLMTLCLPESRSLGSRVFDVQNRPLSCQSQSSLSQSIWLSHQWEIFVPIRTTQQKYESPGKILTSEAPANKWECWNWKSMCTQS